MRRGTNLAALASLLAPVGWAAVATVEIARSNIGHSLTARPERFFSDPAWHWPLVILVTAVLLAELAAGLTLIVAERGRARLMASLAPLLLGLALGARFAMALLLPSDPGGYSVGAEAALAANLYVALMPLALLAAAAAVLRTMPGLAFASAAIAVAMIVLASWAMVWAAWSGASQPQLLAVMPVEGLAAGWAFIVGAWLLDWPSKLTRSLRLPDLPRPGRMAALVLAATAIVGVVGTSASYFKAFQTTIEAQLNGKTQVERIFADSVERTYRVHRPGWWRLRPGLVIVLHGSFKGGFQAETSTGFDAEAERLGWIVAYPDGVADGWDAFGSGPTWGRHPGADDIAFMRALIAHLEKTDSVDPDRIYVTGHSRGGMMAYRLGCELSDVVAAIAPVSGNMATADGSANVPCSLTTPISVLAIHGTADRTIPMAGGRVDIVFSPMADVIARWRSLDGCAGSPKVNVAGTITTTAWSCAGGSAVETRILEGGCHCWPWDAARVIADFFVAHPRVHEKSVG